jgi:hypothetical protein
VCLLVLWSPRPRVIWVGSQAPERLRRRRRLPLANNPSTMRRSELIGTRSAARLVELGFEPLLGDRVALARVMMEQRQSGERSMELVEAFALGLR